VPIDTISRMSRASWTIAKWHDEHGNGVVSLIATVTLDESAPQKVHYSVDVGQGVIDISADDASILIAAKAAEQ
jgi:hypothetical protein